MPDVALLLVFSGAVAAVGYVVLGRLRVRRRYRIAVAVTIFLLVGVLPLVLLLLIGDPAPLGARSYTPEEVANPKP